MRPRFKWETALSRLRRCLTLSAAISVVAYQAAPIPTACSNNSQDQDAVLLAVGKSFSRTIAGQHADCIRLDVRGNPRSKPDPSSQTTSQHDTRRLNPGQLIERTIVAGEFHNYEIALEAGQYFRVGVDPRGSYISVGLFGSDGGHLVGAAFRTETHGRRLIWGVAETSGVYTVKLSTIGEDATARRYGISIGELREATPQERQAQAARMKLEHATKLYLENTAESLAKALEEFKEALGPLRAAGATWSEATNLYLTAATYNSLGEYQKAIDACNEALPLWRAFADALCVGTLTVMGESYYYLSDYQKALDVYFEAMRKARSWPGYRPEEDGWPLNNIGSVYDALGDKQKALDYYSRGLAISRKTLSDYGSNRGIGIGQTNVGGVYVSLGDPQKALECFKEALPHWRAANDVWGEARVLHRMGLVYELLGDTQAALGHYGQALPLWRKTADRWNEALTLNNIGAVYGSLVDYQQAMDHLDQALKIRRALGNRNGEATTLYNIARIERDRGNLAISRERIEEALRLIEYVRTSVVDQELRSSYFVAVHQYYELYIGLLMQLHRLDSRGGFDAAALQASERGRARSLVEMLMEARADIRQGVDIGLVEREQSLQRRLNARAYTNNPPAKRRDAHELTKELEQVIADLQQVQAQIKSASPRYAALTQPQALKVSEIQQQVLDSNTMLLEYALGEERSFVWAVSDDSIASFPLPSRAVIEAEARLVYELLTARSRRSKGETARQWRATIARADREYIRAAGRLSQMILGPLAPLLGKKRLLVVADGALHYVPFPAIPVPHTRNRPLIADHEIVSLPSASTLAVLRRELTGRPPAKKTLTVLADPVFSVDDDRVQNPAKSKRRSDESPRPATAALRDLHTALRDVGVEDLATGLPRLYGTRLEAEQLERLAPPPERLIVLDFDASRETAASGRLADYRIVHFASHALVDTKHPELSGIVLSLVDEHGRPTDGFLRAHEIYNLKLPAELVVLNGCRTGLGKEVRGEGLIGLTRGFMYAGAARVLVSLWSIDDRASADLMRRMYGKMLGRERLSAAAALRAAQVEIWREGSYSPYYWAGFSLQGEWK